MRPWGERANNYLEAKSRLELLRRKITINVDDHIGGIADIHADGSAGPRRNESRIADHAAIGRCESPYLRHGLSGWPGGQVSQGPRRHYCDIQRIGLRC